MRRTVPLALLAVLASCTVTTTGAPCTSDGNCPSDQGCGTDRVCSTAALSCPGHTTAGECVPGTSCSGAQVVTCTASGGVCATGSSATCADPGKACTASGGGAACACPSSGACAQLDGTRCSAGGGEIERCRPVTSGSACLTWQSETSCDASGLVCRSSACVCPANPGPIYVADPLHGNVPGAPPRPTGLSSPAGCRFQTLTDALAAAGARGAGSTVQAAGWTAAAPGVVVLFTEPGSLSVGPGVSLTTDDATPTTDHYAVTTAAAPTGPLVTVGPGASVTGFELRNAASTGDGVKTSCPAAADANPVSISTVKVTAASNGTPVTRLASGIHVTGYCPVEISTVSVDGAATGLLVESASPAIESTASSAGLTGSTVAGAAVVEGKLTLSGGTIDHNAAGALVGTTGAGGPALQATGTAFRLNAGDGVHVARGTFLSDGCPFADNGTHVHAQPEVGATVAVTVQNSSGAARMTGAADSALRLLAMGAGSTLVITGNEIRGNGATQDYTVASGQRRGGGLVFTAPFAGSVVFRGNTVAQNAWDQVLVAASTGALDLRGGSACNSPTPADKNTFKCYDVANQGVGLYSNGASVAADWNRWSNQPAVVNVDFAGTGISGENAACSLDRACP